MLLNSKTFVIFSTIFIVCARNDHDRHKRFALVWKTGLNWVQLVCGIGLPAAEVERPSVTFGPVVKAYYRLPDNSSIYTNPEAQGIIAADARLIRTKRDVISRWNLYEIAQRLLDKYGLGDGKACMLGAICETASHPFNRYAGILNEIVHIILTPSFSLTKSKEVITNEYLNAEILGRKGEVPCKLLYRECKSNIIEMYTRILSL